MTASWVPAFLKTKQQQVDSSKEFEITSTEEDFEVLDNKANRATEETVEAKQISPAETATPRFIPQLTPETKPLQHYLNVFDNNPELADILKNEHGVVPLNQVQRDRIYALDRSVNEDGWNSLIDFTSPAAEGASTLLYESSFYEFMKEYNAEKKTSNCCSRFFYKDSSNHQEWLFYYTLLSGKTDINQKRFVKTAELRKLYENPEPFIKQFMEKHQLLTQENNQQRGHVRPKIA